MPGNPRLHQRGGKASKVHLSSWGFLGSPHAVVPSGAKESCGREVPAPGWIIPGSSISNPPFPHRGWGKIQDFSLRNPFHTLKGVYFSILPDFVLDLISAKIAIPVLFPVLKSTASSFCGYHPSKNPSLLDPLFCFDGIYQQHNKLVLKLPIIGQMVVFSHWKTAILLPGDCTCGNSMDK